jgi:hypothetical protein
MVGAFGITALPFVASLMKSQRGNVQMSDASHTTSRRNPIATLFLDHPATVDETYLQHMRFAFSFAFWLAAAAGAALVHAFIPALCETTASRILKRLHARIESRH